MGMGVAVLMVFCLFIGFCWLISGWIIRNKSKKHYGLKRGIVFLIPALAPFYIQVVGYILFQQACKEAVVYFPENKVDIPKSIISGQFLFDDPIKDFNSLFSYVIAPTSSNKFKLDNGKKQVNDYSIYPLEKGTALEVNKRTLINATRYLISSEIIMKKWYAYKSSIYMILLKERKYLK